MEVVQYIVKLKRVFQLNKTARKVVGYSIQKNNYEGYKAKIKSKTRQFLIGSGDWDIHTSNVNY